MPTYKEQRKAKFLQQELERQEELSAINDSLAIDFVTTITKDIPWQRNFLLDESPRKALFGERRGGKTTLMAIAAIFTALTKPYSQILYLGQTQKAVEKVMYNQILPSIMRQFPVPAKLIGDEQMKFDNGSIIYLVGVDANKKQKDRVRGVKSSLNIVDEMQSHKQDTRELITEVLGPTVADTNADTIIGGTAGNTATKSYWYEITQDNTKEEPIKLSEKHPEWIVYRCEWSKNTAIDEMTNNRVCDNVAKYLADWEKNHPGISKTSGYEQEWNAKWITDTNILIYRYSDSNLVSSPYCVENDTGLRIPMPNEEFLKTATYILGIDIGYNDETALVVVAYNLKYSNKLYVIETYAKPHLLVPDIAQKIKELDRRFNFAHMVGDSSNLTVFEELRIIYGFPIQKADRQGKLSHQLLLNSDLQTRSIIFMPFNDRLIEQLQTVIWKEEPLKEGKYVEDPAYKNDISDAFLYAHNYSRAAWYEAPKPKANFTSNQEMYERFTKQLMNKNKTTRAFGDINFEFPND